MNKAKIILFDVDGVLIRPPYYYSHELEKMGYKDAVKVLNSFFSSENNWSCLEGKNDAYRIVEPYLKKIGWKKTAREYFQEQFIFEEQYLDKELVLMVDKLRASGIKCYLCTDQEKNRADFLLQEMGFEKIFDQCFMSCHIGCRKSGNQFWEHVMDELKKEIPGITPHEVIFFDDDQKNVEKAAEFGIRSHVVRDIEKFKEKLATFL